MSGQFGFMIRQWRRTRGYTQQRLAGDAEVSARHLSCLERSVSNPSREMVLVLASVLEVPLRERNELLRAAGYASVYRESGLSANEMVPVRRALDFLKRQHEPFPVLVIDRGWNVVEHNNGARRLFSAFLGAPLMNGVNIIEALFGPLRHVIVDPDSITGAIGARLARDARNDHVARALYARFADQFPRPAAPLTPALLLPLHLRNGDLEAKLFTTLTTLGTPSDITAQELSIETYFPADDETRALLERLAQEDVESRAS